MIQPIAIRAAVQCRTSFGPSSRPITMSRPVRNHIGAQVTRSAQVVHARILNAAPVMAPFPMAKTRIFDRGRRRCTRPHWWPEIRMFRPWPFATPRQSCNPRTTPPSFTSTYNAGLILLEVIDHCGRSSDGNRYRGAAEERSAFTPLGG